MSRHDDVSNTAGKDARETPVDELRQRLRALGYLDAGVDRFVLGAARSSHGAVALAVLASVRIGILGALLLGPAAALGIGSGLPGLVTSVRDRVVMALYMAALFGVAITGAALAAALLVSLTTRGLGPAIARYARGLAVLTGVLVGGACLVYLTLLWTAARSAGPEASFGLSTGLALAVAVGISLLLGHAVMLSALALVVSSTGAPLVVSGVPGASWRMMLGAGVLAFAGALIVSTADSRAHPAPAAPPHLTVIASGVRVRLLAIDGFDPEVFGRVAAGGRVPALTRALSGASAQLALTEPDEPEGTRLDPARVWTTIATAQPAARHGVRTLETRRLAGIAGALQGSEGTTAARLARASTDVLRLTRPSVASGSQRREKAFWEVADEAGLRTVVVNWWATWPVIGGTGIVLSDRATLRLERGGALDGEISPAPVYDALHARWPALRERADALAAKALDTAIVSRDIASILHRSAAIDALTLLLAREATDSAPDLTATFLTGLDIARLALTGMARDDVAADAAAAALDAYYVVLDTLLANVLTPDSDELVMIVTSPGRAAAQSSGRLTLTGRGSRSGSTAQGRATDVGPSVLYALGLPISADLQGAPILELFEPSFVERYSVRRVPTYGGRVVGASGARGGRPLDEEMVERLRSLGYVR